jgi:hypothetical protein
LREQISLSYETPPGGPNVIINCPRCGAKHVPATCHTITEIVNLIWRKTTTWVRCSACGTELHSKRRPDDVLGRSPEELEGVIVYRISLIPRFLAIAAIVLSVWPLLGLILSLVSLAVNWRHGRWLKKVSLIAVTISVLVHLAIGVLFLTQK